MDNGKKEMATSTQVRGDPWIGSTNVHVTPRTLEHLQYELSTYVQFKFNHVTVFVLSIQFLLLLSIEAFMMQAFRLIESLPESIQGQFIPDCRKVSIYDDPPTSDLYEELLVVVPTNLQQPYPTFDNVCQICNCIGRSTVDCWSSLVCHQFDSRPWSYH